MQSDCALYHYRPGGVRRVIELALPHLIRKLEPRIDTVVLAGGELPDLHWVEYLTKQLPRMSVELPTDPALGYLSESESAASEVFMQAREAVRDILRGADAKNCIVWAHNLGLARNPLMARAIMDETAVLGVTLIAHHHDWWFDNRWQRWPEMRRAGIRSLKDAARVIFSTHPNIRHVTINQTDLAPLQRHLGERVHWLPNLMEKPSRPSPSALTNARLWLDALASAFLSRSLFKPELVFWSFEHGFGKPDPYVFRLLSARLLAQGVSAPETLMIGDRQDNDIEPACAQYWQTWQFISTAQSAGCGCWQDVCRQVL